MGPSGYGFLHPAAINTLDPLVDGFVERTLDAATLMRTSAFVHWDDYNNAAIPDREQRHAWASAHVHTAETRRDAVDTQQLGSVLCAAHWVLPRSCAPRRSCAWNCICRAASSPGQVCSVSSRLTLQWPQLVGRQQWTDW